MNRIREVAGALVVGLSLLLVGVVSGGVRGVPTSASMVPVAAALVTMVVIVLADRTAARRARALLGLPVGMALVVFAACYAVSAVGGVTPRVNLGTSLGMLLGASFAWVVAWWGCTRERVQSLVLLFVIGSLGATVPALFQSGQIEVSYGGGIVTNRPAGAFVDPNELGVYAAITVVAAVILVGTTPTRLGRVTAVVALCAASGGLVLSFSRGSWVACLAGFLVLVLLAPLRRIVLWFVPSAVLSVVAAWAAGFPLPVATAAERLSTLVSGNTNPYDYRPQIWQEAWQRGWEHPLFGWGPGAFRTLSAQADSPIWFRPVRHAHSGVLNTFVENGLPATIAAVIASVLLVTALLRRARPRPVDLVGLLDARMAAGTLAVLAVVGTHLTTDYALRNFVVMVTVWFWVGIGWAQLLRTPRPDAPASSAELAEPVLVPAARTRASGPLLARLAPSVGNSVLAAIGSIVSAGSGLLLVLLVARGLGVAATGVFFVCLAVGMVSLALSKAGYDTALVHVVPRLGALGGISQLRALLVASVARVTLLATGLAVVLHLSAPWLAAHLLAGSGADLTPALQAVAWSVPAAAPSLVMLSVLRARQSLRPLVAWDQVVKPLGRLVAVGTTIALGGGVVAAVQAWSAVQWVVLAGSMWEARTVLTGARPVSARLREALAGYSRRRWASSVLEMVNLYVGILVIAAFSTAEQTGQLSVASRVATAGLLALQAARLALAPQVSAALALRDTRAAERLHLVSTSWVVLVAWPAYLVLLLGSPRVMGWFGPEFEPAWPVLAVLALAGLVAVAAGNVQTVLLMSGRAGAYLLVAVTSLAVNTTLALAFVGSGGAMGVAAASATATVVENVAIGWWVWRREGVRATGAPVITAMAVSLLFAPMFWAWSAVLPDNVLSVPLAAALAGAAHLGLAWRTRSAYRPPDVDVVRRTPPLSKMDSSR